MSYPSDNYIYCFVPGCKSTSVSTPDKLFFQVPKGEIREKWCIAVGRDTSLSRTTNKRCCEDHFVLEEDVHNWIYYKALMDAGRVPILRLKKDALPHLCLPKGKIDLLEERKKEKYHLLNRPVSKNVVTAKPETSGLEECCYTGENLDENTTHLSLKYSSSTEPNSAILAVTMREHNYPLKSRVIRRDPELIKTPQLPHTASILKNSEVYLKQRRTNTQPYPAIKAPQHATYSTDAEQLVSINHYGEGSSKFTSEILDQISSFGIHFLSQ